MYKNRLRHRLSSESWLINTPDFLYSVPYQQPYEADNSTPVRA